MPAILHLPTPTLNDAATQILTARSTSTSTTSPPDYSDPGSIAGFVWFGIVGIVVLIGFASVLIPLIAMPFIIPYLIVKKLYEVTVAPPLKRRAQNKRAAWTARNDRRNELQSRGYVRQRWAQEELQLARKDGRTLNLPGSYGRIVDLETGRRKKEWQKFPFDELPAEIRLEIYSYLDYGTALKLMRVSKFLYFDRPISGIGREQQATFLWHAETFARNTGLLACFGCLKMRRFWRFEKDRREGDFARFGEREVERRCFDCQVQEGEVRWPMWSRVVRYWMAPRGAA